MPCHCEAERLGGLGVPRSRLVLEIDAGIRREIARTQTPRDRARTMTTWQGMDLVETREHAGGRWKIRRKV